MDRRIALYLRRAFSTGAVAALVGSCLGTIGCESDFDPASKLNSLRVLAVKADNPYPKPGDTVNLEMLWFDAKAPTTSADGGTAPARKIEVLWIGGCFNPTGDLYYGCYSDLAKIFGSASSDPTVTKYLGNGNTFSLQIPSDIISSRPAKEGVDPYGLSYVFFAVCAGKIGPSSNINFGLPLGCFDDQGTELGADDFVPGYFSLYSYNDRTNKNPVMTALEVNGDITENDLTLPVCNTSPCAEYGVRAHVDPASAEVDPDGLGPNGETLTEQMWVDYYASGGSLGTGAKLVNDATKGWNEEDGTTFKAPSEAATVSIFAVVHDNRGGVVWARRNVKIQ